MKKELLLTAIILALSIRYLAQNGRYTVGDEIILGNLSLVVLETKTDYTIVRRPLVVHEFPGGVYVGEGKGFETLDALKGHKFFLVKLQMKNLGEERLHLIGKEYKVLSAGGEIFYPGVISRGTRNASEDDSKNHYYPPLITMRTLLPRQEGEGWLTFEIPEATEPEKFIWYSEFQKRKPSFTVKLKQDTTYVNETLFGYHG